MIFDYIMFDKSYRFYFTRCKRCSDQRSHIFPFIIDKNSEEFIHRLNLKRFESLLQQ